MSQAAHNTVERAAEPAAVAGSSRAFVRVFGGTFVALVTVIAALNVAVDPLAKLGTGLLRPIVWLDRDEKVASFARRTPPPRAIVIGSSRAMKLAPSCMAELDGKPAFNFAVNSARAEDYLAVASYAIAHAPIERILLSVDPEAFHDHLPPDDRLLDSRALRSYVSVPRPSPWRTRVEALFGDQATKASLRSLWTAAFAPKEVPQAVFLDDGFLRYPKWEAQIAAGTFSLDGEIALSVIEYHNRFAGFDALSPERVATLRRMLELAKAHGVVVDAFVSPLHPTLEAKLADTSWAQRTADTTALLVGLERAGLVRHHALQRLTDFGGDPRDFLDGAHMNERNSSRLLRALYGASSGCAVQ